MKIYRNDVKLKVAETKIGNRKLDPSAQSPGRVSPEIRCSCWSMVRPLAPGASVWQTPSAAS